MIQILYKTTSCMLSLYLWLNSVQILSRLLRIMHLRMPHAKQQAFKTPKAMSVVQAYTRIPSFSLVLNIHLHVLDKFFVLSAMGVLQYDRFIKLLQWDIFIQTKKEKGMCFVSIQCEHPAVVLLHAVNCDLHNYSFLIFIQFPNYKHTSVLWEQRQNGSQMVYHMDT